MNMFVTHKKFEVSLNELGFYYLHIFGNSEITIDDVKLIIAAKKKLCGKKRPTLVVCDEFASTSTEVLNYISKNENFPCSIAGAYVLSSISQKLMANFYLKFNVPERPTKFFTNKNDAIEWLKQYI